MVIYGMWQFDTVELQIFLTLRKTFQLSLRRKSTQKITVDIWNLDYYFPPAKPNHESDGRWEDGGWGPQPATITLQVMLIMMTHSKQILGESLSIISKTRLIVCSGKNMTHFTGQVKSNICTSISQQWARKLKKSPGKKTREIK